MNIIIPMAGAGSRFSIAGFKLPKPLIPVHDQAMYHWAVDSLPLKLATALIFIIRLDEFTNQLITDINKNYGHLKPKIKIIPHVTQGQSETIYLAKDLLDLSQPSLIHNADTAFEDMELPSDNAFGALVTFQAPPNDARWSFASIHSNKIIEVREKSIISPHASTGTYYFSSTPWLIDAIKIQLEQKLKEQNEYYISPLYNIAIAENKWIQPLKCNNFICLGTPEELKASIPRLPTLERFNSSSQLTKGFI